LAAAILSTVLNFQCCPATRNHTSDYPFNDF